jgi:hypothetical protein
MTHFSPTEMLEDPESATAGRIMRQTFLQGHLAEQLEYLESEPALPSEWVRAATSGDIIAYLSPDELRELSDEVNALAEKWNRERGDASPGALPIRFIYASFLQP